MGSVAAWIRLGGGIVWAFAFIVVGCHKSPVVRARAGGEIVQDETLEGRVALVIGNASYKGDNKLETPVADAEAIVQRLEAFDFDVVTVSNANRAAMWAAIREFKELAQSARHTVVYYSGHGLQHLGANYLLPVDGGIDPARLTDEGVNTDDLLLPQSPDRVQVFILDACRTYTLAAGAQTGLGSVGRRPNNSLWVFAAQPGEKAYERSDQPHGLFTQALINAMDRSPRTVIEDLMKEVVTEVKAQNLGQHPGYTAFVSSPFTFHPDGPVDATAKTVLDATNLRPKLLRLAKGRLRWHRPEGGQRTVTVFPFWAAETEVTQAQWEAVLGRNPALHLHPENPVERISWFDALEYLNALSEKEGLDRCYDLSRCRGSANGGCPPTENACFGDYECPTVAIAGTNGESRCKGYRLPTDAEWEWLARADDGRVARPWWSQPGQALDDHAWFADRGGLRPSAVKRQPQPNDWGLYDVVGNVWEWTDDSFGSGAASGRVGPLIAVRGCAYDSDQAECRATSARGVQPSLRFSRVGVRPVRSAYGR